ncbi:hypothetical protein FG386_002500 [Cryptosporidium ryanae]|uniref:uncharacterized protein n=1 Tax=Cryptosporidium ryanae TaxID=515981 RepID=UPI003519E9C7|nr:hypothetical protein FG386_002500 [Cryptosporidium ryanae]
MVTSLYRCKRCSSALFSDKHIIEHLQNKIVNENNGQNPYSECTSIFVLQMNWMEDFWMEKGKIICPNPKCDAKIGYYSWHGVRCSCGFWQTPAFQIHKSKIDYLPDPKKQIKVDISHFE